MSTLGFRLSALSFTTPGLPVKVAHIGGSVSLTNPQTDAPDAGWVSLFHKWLELAFTPCGDAWPAANGGL